MKALRFTGSAEAERYLQEKGQQESGKAFVLFAPVAQVQALSGKAAANVVLCSTAGEYTSRGYESGVVTGFEYSAAAAQTVEIGNPPARCLSVLEQAYDTVKDNKNAFMLLLCDGLGGEEELVLSTFFRMRPDFKIIGGSAGDNQEFRETLIYIGGRRVRHVALFFNPSRPTTLLKENIYSKTGKTLLVTRSDVLSRTVYTFNNRPASEEYARLLGVPEAELPRHFINHPLGKGYSDDVFIASPMKVNPDRSITFYCELMANTFVHLLQPENPLEVLAQTLACAPRKPSFVFAVHCILRSIKFTQDRLWPEYDRQLVDYCGNIAGFVSYGEQYYKNHSNQTMVILTME